MGKKKKNKRESAMLPFVSSFFFYSEAFFSLFLAEREKRVTIHTHNVRELGRAMKTKALNVTIHLLSSVIPGALATATAAQTSER